MTWRDLITEILESGINLDENVDLRVVVQAKNYEVQTSSSDGEYDVDITVDTHELEGEITFLPYGSYAQRWVVLEVETEELDLT